MSKIPKVYVLVGVPGSGKSTWIANQDWALACVVVSTDHWIEVFARELGLTYNQVFDQYMPAAVHAMAAQVAMAQQHGCDIIWDQTSLTVASRRKKFNMLPNYEHIAVVFNTPEPAELEQRLTQRPNKVVPNSVITRMIDSFEPPSESEGYKQIWTAQ